MSTLGEQSLGGFVGVHVGLREHGDDVGVGAVPYDLFDGSDGASHGGGDRLGAAIHRRVQDHGFGGIEREGMGARGMVLRRGVNPS